MGRSRVKMRLIADQTSRRKTFNKRKAGIMKKLDELTTICDVKACAVFSSPFDSSPEAWPSREGVGEVYSKFMEVPVMERTKKMMNQESYLQKRILKEQEQLNKMREENRELAIRELMFDCVKGKMKMENYHYDASVIQDLCLCIDRHLNKVTRRIEILTANGESSSLSPFPDVTVAYAAPPAGFAYAAPPAVVADAAPPAYAHIQYLNMNMNQQVPVQYQDPARFYDLQHPVQYQNVSQQEPVQYQVPTGSYNQNQQRLYERMIHDLTQNQNQQESLMEFLMGGGGHSPQMGNVEEHASIPSMEDNPYRYYQLSTPDLGSTSHMPSFTTASVTATADLASTSYMPSFTTAAAADLFAPNTNNNH